jgi:hypothetical protein
MSISKAGAEYFECSIPVRSWYKCDKDGLYVRLVAALVYCFNTRLSGIFFATIIASPDCWAFGE